MNENINYQSEIETILDNKKILLIKYLNQDINNPKYLFHGSTKIMNKITPHQSIDSSDNKNNIANAIFLFPSFLKATPYAFKDKIKEISEGLAWNFVIPNTNHFPLMIMENVNIDDDIIGYIYVFEKKDYMKKDEKSYQYKCYDDLIPCDVVEVRYRDYKEYYKIENVSFKSR